MSKEYEKEFEEVHKKIAALYLSIMGIVKSISEIRLAVENLALQTTNNQVETRKALDAIKSGVLDTNLAVKYPNQ